MRPQRSILFVFAVVGCGGANPISPVDGGPGADAAADVALEVSAPGTCDVDAGPWQAMVTLNQSDCATRPLTECPQVGGTLREALGNKLLRFASDSCQLPSYNYLQVEFVSGCPSAMSLKTPVSILSPQLVDCLTTALVTQRWSCAGERSCVIVEHDTLP